MNSLGGSIRLDCPLTKCDWSHTEPIPDVAMLKGNIDEATLTECGGDVVQAVALTTARTEAARVDSIVREHLTGHTLEEWTRELSDLREELKHAREQQLQCAPCVQDAINDAAEGKEPREVLPAKFQVNGMTWCGVRHQIVTPAELARRQASGLLIPNGQPPQFPHNGSPFGG